jgi:hypothetical protein
MSDDAISPAEQEENPPASVRALVEKAHEYNNRLGMFILLYSKAEAAFYKSLLYPTQVSDEVGKIVFQRINLATILNYLSEIIKAGLIEDPKGTHLANVIKQMDAIRLVRNDLVHKTLPGYSFAGLKPREYSPGGYAVSLEDLGCMLTDLQEIEIQLRHHLPPSHVPAPEHHSEWKFQTPRPR